MRLITFYTIRPRHAASILRLSKSRASLSGMKQSRVRHTQPTFDHSDVPFEKVVETIQPDRLLGRHPLFQIMFMFEDSSVAYVERDGLVFATDVLPVDRSSYWDLELSVADSGYGSGLSAFLGLRTDILDAESLAWWVVKAHLTFSALSPPMTCSFSVT